MLLEHVTHTAQKSFDVPVYGYAAFNRNNSEVDKAELQSSEWCGYQKIAMQLFLDAFFGTQRKVWGI